MNFESVSKGFIFAIAVYLIDLLYGLNFIFANISFGGLTSDFWLLTLIILLPLILSIIYMLRGKLEFLYGQSTLLKRLIIIFIALATIFVVFFIIPLSY